VSETRRATYERLVHDWARPIYALAYRMLHRRADADDATQEVFVRLWERIESYDPSRPFKPWIYRVATNTILNRARGEKTRAEKESHAPAHADAETTEDAVQRREREQIVQEGLASLDGESRALLAMHYYGGLTQEEVAEVLDVPRSTVRSRLGNALDELRASLRGGGHLAVLPGLEDAMRSSPPPPLPDSLLSSLLHVGAPAVVAVAVPVIGGILVTKKLLAVASILAALTIGGGFAAGYIVRGARAAYASPDSATAPEVARLLEENRRLAAQVGDRPGTPTLAASGNAKPVNSPAAVESASSASAPNESDSPTPPSAGATAPIDWSKLAAIFATNLDRLLAMMIEGEDQGDQMKQMKPEDQQTVMELLAEYMRVSRSAHALSPHPFFDERVLPGLVDAVYGETLGLSKEKRAALSETLRALVASRAKTLDFERMGPVETYVARQQTVADVLAAVGVAAGPDGRERFEKMQLLGESMLTGDQMEYRLGWDGKAPASSIGERILAAWEDAYGLDDKQMDAVRPIADRYAQDAIDVLRRRGIDKADVKVSNRDSHAAGLEMIGLQVGTERTIHGLLHDKQRERVRNSPPTLVVVHPGSEHDRVHRSNWGGI